MKDSTIALSIASVVTVLAVVYLYYGPSYVGHGSSGNSHGKNYSKGHYGGHGHHGGLYHILRFKEQLGLTEDQVTQINNLKFEHEKKKIDFHLLSQIQSQTLTLLLYCLIVLSIFFFNQMVQLQVIYLV